MMESLFHGDAVVDPDITHIKAPYVTTAVMHSLDHEWLAKWIQPQHFDQEVFRTYQEAYHERSMPVIRIPNFLVPNVAQMLSAFFTSEAEYEEIYGLYVPDEGVSQDKWLAAEERNRMYKFSRLIGTKPGARSFNPLIYAKFRDAAADRRFAAFFEHIVGLTLGSLQSLAGNSFGVGDYLRPHHDISNDRRLAFIIYLNPKWIPEYGGSLRVTGHDGQRIELDVEYNSLVMFDVRAHKHHCIEKINTIAGEQRRLSLGGWLNDANH